MSLGDEVDRIKAERADAQRAAAADAERAMQHWHAELQQLWSEVERYCRDRGLPLPTHEVRTYTPKRDWLGRPKRDGSHDEHIAYETGLLFGAACVLVPPGRMLMKDGPTWVSVEPRLGYGQVFHTTTGSDSYDTFGCGPDGPITMGFNGRPLRQSIIEALASM